MPKFPTFPTLYEDCKTINISNLKCWGYLSPNQYKAGSIKWSIDGNNTGSTYIIVNTNLENPYLELNYQCNASPILYRVQLISFPSNLGKGSIWFFICPKTNNYCRKLHLVGNYFYHRSAFKGCMYENQTYSHQNRSLFSIFKKAQAVEDAFEQIYSKHFKKQYKGKPTKRYVALLKQAKEGE